MAKKLGTQQWILIGVGAALGYAGWRFEWPPVIGIGVALAGLKEALLPRLPEKVGGEGE